MQGRWWRVNHENCWAVASRDRPAFRDFRGLFWWCLALTPLQGPSPSASSEMSRSPWVLDVGPCPFQIVTNPRPGQPLTRENPPSRRPRVSAPRTREKAIVPRLKQAPASTLTSDGMQETREISRSAEDREAGTIEGSSMSPESQPQRQHVSDWGTSNGLGGGILALSHVSILPAC